MCGQDLQSDLQSGYCSATVLQSLIAGEVSFAHVGAVLVIAAVASGIDLKISAVFMNRFNYVMVTLPDLQKAAGLLVV